MGNKVNRETKRMLSAFKPTSLEQLDAKSLSTGMSKSISSM